MPNYFPRPQLAHMSSDRPMSLSPLTWHTPTTTEPPTNNVPTPLYNLQQMMLADTRPIQQNPLENIALATRDRLEGLGITLNRQASLDAIQNFTRQMTLPTAGVGSVDLTLSRSMSSPHSLPVPPVVRNGQNGESTGPISLSVRDTKQINSMDTAELTKLQTTGRSLDIINTNLVANQRSNSPKSPKPFKRSAKKMDTVLERLNSAPADLCSNARQSPGITVKDDIISQISFEAKLPSISAPAPTASFPSSIDNRMNAVLISEDSSELPDKTRHKRKPDKTTRIEKEMKENDSSAECLSELCTIPQTGSVVIADEGAIQNNSSVVPNVSNDADDTDIDPPNEGLQNSLKPDELNVPEVVNNISEENMTKQNVLDKSEHDQKNSERSPNDSNATLLTHLPLNETEIMEPERTQHETKVLMPLEASHENNCDNKSVGKSLLPQIIKRRNSNDDSHTVPLKVRKKTCSESETIDNIAAMIASGENTSVIVPIVSKNMNNETNLVNDSQSLAHVLAGPICEDNLEKNLSTNNDETELMNPIEEQLISNNICLEKIDKEGSDVGENNTTSFVQVENELEKMFAGIDENAPPIKKQLSELTQVVRDNVTSTSNDNNLKRKMSNVATRAIRKSSDSTENTPKKKKLKDPNKRNQVGTKNLKIKGGKIEQKNKNLKCKMDVTVKDVLTYDSGSNTSSNKSKGPFIQIKGPRDSPISVSIVNTSINEDDSENRMKHHKTKKHHDDADFRQKMRKGLHSSTLSMKYDATTTDVTWVCVFCKNGPHCGGTNLGDLFGPYLVTTSCPEFEYSTQNPEDDPFKSKRTKQDLIAKNTTNPNKAIKKKRSINSDITDKDIYNGMVEASQGAYEVWGHEECIIWAPGVFLVGSRVIGLEGAVWSSCRAKCNLCNLTGANVSCSQRGCEKFAHISCASRHGWLILEDVYKATCPNHHST